ncbi:S41 family peptidase [Lacticaseibacillus baoqingensis]
MTRLAKKPHLQVPAWLLAVGMSVTLVGGGVIGYLTHTAVSAAAPSTASLPAGFNQVLQTYATIQSGYYKKTTSKQLTAGAINGMLESLKDPYSTYLANDSKSSLDSTLSASFGGIGATVQQSGNKLTIESIMPNTPSKKAGLKVGDQLIAVDGKSVEKADVTTAVDKIRGKIGTTVKVTIKRNSAQQTFAMKRAKITTDTVVGALDKTDKHVGVITMATFSEPTAKQFQQTVKKLRKQGATSFVLDLRGNPGGMLDQALKIASMCLKNGQTIVKVQDRNGNTQNYKANKKYDDGFKVTEPLAILIDGNSASASEILSAALNENLGSPLVGEQSYGKGTVQNVMPISKTAEVKLTVAKWLTPKGNWINKKGLTPTAKVAYPDYLSIKSISAKSLKLGDESGNVKSLQQLLKALGQDPGTINGFYGPTTQAAVTAFQKANHLPANGTADEKTLSALVAKLVAKYQDQDPQLQAAVKAAAK